MTSATYRQSSKARQDLQQIDPANTLLARQSRIRLPAEYIRDSALVVSDLLDPAVGGKSVRPAQPKGVADLAYASHVTWKESEGRERYRRGLYIQMQRTVPYPMLVNFDGADASVSVCQRGRSDTPLQALNLLNDPVFVEAAQALAVRILGRRAGGLSGATEICISRLSGPAAYPGRNRFAGELLQHPKEHIPKRSEGGRGAVAFGREGEGSDRVGDMGCFGQCPAQSGRVHHSGII